MIDLCFEIVAYSNCIATMFDIWPAVYSVHVHMHVLGACEMLTGRYTCG